MSVQRIEEVDQRALVQRAVREGEFAQRGQHRERQVDELEGERNALQRKRAQRAALIPRQRLGQQMQILRAIRGARIPFREWRHRRSPEKSPWSSIEASKPGLAAESRRSHALRGPPHGQTSYTLQISAKQTSPSEAAQ